MPLGKVDHEGLLELDPADGSLRFSGQKALLLDAVAVGILRKFLIEDLGTHGARALLTQFGFAQGWRMAEAMQSAFKWESDEDWQNAGFEINRLQGLFLPAAGGKSPLSSAGAVLASSYEADQHLLHFGVSESPVCWTVCGLVSGYLSRSSGQEIYVLEDSCQASGEAACHLWGRTRAGWGEARAKDLKFFNDERLSECLDVSLDRVTRAVKMAEGKLRKRQRTVPPAHPDGGITRGIVAKSPEMSSVIVLTRRVAKADVTVVITGESGSGKERIARLLHDESPRAAGPFIAINCAAITESLLESELFGHARGSFSGALHDRPGLFEAAEGGTLLLDEVGELPLGMQTKLLRVLQEREVRRVGENKSRAVDVRIVAATNIDLEGAVRRQAFRQDLYYRLNVVAIHVPALRERRDDILPLARLMVSDASRQMRRPVKALSDEAADHLLRYAWPGNARELENAVQRAVALSEASCIDLDDLPAEVRLLSVPQSSRTWEKRTLHEVERDHILTSLQVNGGNQARTAKALEIGSATLYRKLKRYKEDPEDAADDDPT